MFQTYNIGLLKSYFISETEKVIQHLKSLTKENF